MENRAQEAEIGLRAAEKRDARRIAELFRLSSEGIADYIWTSLAADYAGLSLLDIGELRYARENTAFSYQNCTLATHGESVVGFLHGFVMPEPALPTEEAQTDPVLAPYSDLELPGSFYVSGLAVEEAYRRCGIGRRLLAVAKTKARELGCDRLSLICFERNTNAYSLYLKTGFSEIDRRAMVPHPLIHVSGGDAVLLHKPLEPASE